MLKRDLWFLKVGPNSPPLSFADERGTKDTRGGDTSVSEVEEREKKGSKT